MRIEVDSTSLKYDNEAVDWLCENYAPEDLNKRKFGKVTFYAYYESDDGNWAYKQYSLFRSTDIVNIQDEAIALLFILRFG